METFKSLPLTEVEWCQISVCI